MAAVLVSLRELAGVMFWEFVDLFLIVTWLAVVFGAVVMVIRGARKDD